MAAMASSSSRLRSKPRTRYTEFGIMDTELLDKTSDQFCCRLKVNHMHPLFNKPMFKSPGDVIEGILGKEFDMNYVQCHGLSVPVKFKASEREDLGIRLPLENVTPSLVVELVGGDRSIVAMSVASQKSNVNMKLKDWATYFESAELREQKGILNLISLEFSGTKLASQVVSPNVVRDIDWIDRAWPRHINLERRLIKKTKYKHKGSGSDSFGQPKVQKYCLMSAAGSFTDFHVDFGGTSVWYHLVKGRKVFLLAPPSKVVLDAFEQFTWDSATYLPDLLPCSTFTHCTLEAGETLFIPSGWVHAVYTPVDSLVFGGNFLHSFSVKSQTEVMFLEERTFVKPAMRFPLVNELLWRMALIVVCEVTSAQKNGDMTLPGWLGGATEKATMRVHLSKLLEKTEAPKWVLDPKLLLKCFKDVLNGIEVTVAGVDIEQAPIELEALGRVVRMESPEKEPAQWYLKKVNLSSVQKVKLRQEATLQFEQASEIALSRACKKNPHQDKPLEEILPEVLVVGQLVRGKFKRSAKLYPAVVVAVPSMHSLSLSRFKGKGMQAEYSLAFEDGDFDATVRREHIKGRVLDEDWVERRIEVMKLVKDLQSSENQKRATSKKRQKAGDNTYPFTHPTPSTEAKGVKRHRAMTSPRMLHHRAEFGRMLQELIEERSNVTEQLQVMSGVYREAKMKLQSQNSQLKLMTHPILLPLPDP